MQLIRSCGISSPVNTLHSHQWTVLFQYDPQCDASAAPVEGDGEIRTESVFRCAKTGDFCLAPGTSMQFTDHESTNQPSTLSERVYRSLANTKPLEWTYCR